MTAVYLKIFLKSVQMTRKIECYQKPRGPSCPVTTSKYNQYPVNFNYVVLS